MKVGVDFVTCEVCGGTFKELAGHLRVHHMKSATYRVKFPNALLISEVARESKSKGMTGVAHMKARGVKRPEHSECMRGDRNPAKRPEVRAMWRGDRNPAKRPEVRAKISKALKGRSHPWAAGDKSWPKRYPELAKSVGLKRRGVPHPWWQGKNNPMCDPAIAKKQMDSARPACEKYVRDNYEECCKRAFHALSFVRKNRDSYLERKIHALLHKHRVEHERWPRIRLLWQNGVEFVKELDFFVPGCKLYIEADGCYWHGCPVCSLSVPSDERVTRAMARDTITHEAFVTMERGRLLRFWGHDIRKRLGWVEQELLNVIQVGSLS